MADEHFFPGTGEFPYGLAAAPFVGSSSYAPSPGLDGVAAAMMMQAGFGLPAWPDLQLPDSSAAAHFDSALSSLVSSPAAAHNYAGADDDVAIGDLIGRLGSICNAAAAATSATNSCYSTPLSSPPRGATSPAAMAFRGGGGGRLSRVASSKSLGAGAATPPEAGTTSPTTGVAAVMRDDLAPPPAKGGAARKRKAASGKGKATTSAATAAANAASPPKRSKVAADGEGDGAGSAPAAVAPAPEPEAEAVKDYIHVRARRGQATDSHSLAERVRRERISERMKMLESLVPGCNKF
nr:unnamed protein product [Digitaria exilis]